MAGLLSRCWRGLVPTLVAEGGPRSAIMPLGRPTTDRFVPWIIAPMVALAALALAVAIGLGGVLDRWDAGPGGSLTVEIAPLGDATEQAGPAIEVDDHGVGLDELRRLAETARMTLLAMVGLIALAGVMIVIFVTSAGLTLHAGAIDLLHIMGATDGHVAAVFVRHAARRAGRGIVLGLAAAAAGLAALAWLGSQAVLSGLPIPAPGPEAWLALPLVGAAGLVMAVLTAYVTVMKTLAERP